MFLRSIVRTGIGAHPPSAVWAAIPGHTAPSYRTGTSQPHLAVLISVAASGDVMLHDSRQGTGEFRAFLRSLPTRQIAINSQNAAAKLAADRVGLAVISTHPDFAGLTGSRLIADDLDNAADWKPGIALALGAFGEDGETESGVEWV